MSIIINNVSKSIKKTMILENINIELKYNNIYGIYGKNGSGKSVFLKLITGIYKPTSGIITIDDIDYNKNDYFPIKMGALIESPSFLNDLTGFQNLKLLADLQNKIMEDEINQALKLVSLYEEKDKKYNEYSLGMKQKLGIAQVLMENPNIIILDEPFNGLEDDTITNLIKYLKSIKKDKIILITSHNKKLLNNVSDKMLILEDKQIKELK